MNTDCAGGIKTRKRRRRPRLFLFAILFAVIFAAVWPVFQTKKETWEAGDAGGGRSGSIAEVSPELIPDYSGNDVIILNDGMPCFSDEDFSTIAGEHYSELDRKGRCGAAIAMLHRDRMPIGERGSIGNITPTGWVQKKYPGIVDSEPPYLYNRCHLIAYAMTGQNANAKNLITGTRYMNATTMLPYEKQVLRYLDHSDNHVLYRVSPCFKGSELLARGVEIEAYSVEDNGEGVCIHVFVYNIQPGIEIDYATGENRVKMVS